MSAIEDQDLTDLQFFEIPHMRQLTTEQNAGAACVWCADTLPPGTGIDLRAGLGWAPYSCSSCYEIRVTLVNTYRDLYLHLTSCGPCEAAALAGERLCDRATNRQAALQLARTAAGKDRPVCLSCRVPLTEHDLDIGAFVPLVWMGYSSPYRSFVHTGACMGRLTPPRESSGG
ncbi:hypothetical protein ACIQNU_41380 [Streptomyces sp. NPDC091292]|uniref:hypothetical protein n=1 Tax=Streptomyces sp. NPDC091292 TaxID=3365991 RepID=UPI0037F9E612